MSLSALAQGTRLEAFRALVQHEPSGIAAGDLARLLGVPQNTLSAHLTVLAHAGLIDSTRQGRSIVYRARLTQLLALILYLMKDCCRGRAEVCAPLLREITACLPETQGSICG